MKVFFIFIISSLIALSVSYPFEESDTMKALVEEVVKDILGQSVGEEIMKARLESKEELLRQLLYNQQDEEDEEEEEEAELEQAVCASSPPVVKHAILATYTCQEGSVLTPAVGGPSTSTCQDNGEWSNPPRCIVDCGKPPKEDDVIANYTTTTYESKVTYSCAKLNFQLSGSETATCKRNGKWSDHDEGKICRECTKKDCLKATGAAM